MVSKLVDEPPQQAESDGIANGEVTQAEAAAPQQQQNRERVHREALVHEFTEICRQTTIDGMLGRATDAIVQQQRRPNRKHK